ncbi:hypothetical protein TEA_001782 [Camellia sinensis var. sinensis]|uniref:Peroxisomal adenine nucleotide carrier 1 n=1 Tax=Camellia sinensis var. sinensis TaxID=542762 RepID=A0A4S4DZP1_CAMSN|nr:hypothetical protein TEA_001782 [Camellia sinensis var. sinensis]
MSVDLESLSEATSGAIGALVSTAILYPLDTCKTKYQAEPPSSSNAFDVLSSRVANGKEPFRCFMGSNINSSDSFSVPGPWDQEPAILHFPSIGTATNLILAAAAGACTAIVTQPLDTASSRMQTSAFGKSKGLWQTLTEGSWSEAFDGLGISLLLTSNPAIQYTVFDQLKQRLLNRKQNKTEKGSSPEAISAFSAFALGAISKSIATILTYPAIRCKVMIQAADSNDDNAKKTRRRSRKTVSGVICAIWRKEGVLGFFKGLHAQILKTVLSSALLLMIKEKINAATWVLVLAMSRYLLVTKGRLKNA